MARKQDSNPRQERSLARRSSIREVKKTFLIVCEGVNTEPDYFNAFRLTSATVKAVGEGINTVGLVQKAIKIRQLQRSRGKSFDQCWVVFDKDDFTDDDFNRAIQLARQNDFEVAYSNQSFEYWFLLHFNRYEGEIHRSRYEAMLSDLLNFPYSKKSGISSRLFNQLLPKQQRAITNSRLIHESFSGDNPAREESSTTVYLLVEELNKYL